MAETPVFPLMAVALCRWMNVSSVQIDDTTYDVRPLANGGASVWGQRRGRRGHRTELSGEQLATAFVHAPPFEPGA